jgi:hypothetical protein
MTTTASTTTNTNTNANKLSEERLLFTIQALHGYPVDLQLNTGILLNGILCANPSMKKAEDVNDVTLAFAWTKFLTPRGKNGEEPQKAPRKKPERLKKIVLKDIAWIQAINVGMSDLALGPSRMNDMNDFTDIGISKGSSGQNRTLVAWTPDENFAVSEGLEDNQQQQGRAGGKGAGGAWGRKAPPPGNWDQFAANKQLFGVETKFDESVYTTQIDKSKLGISEADAARIAREIESKVSSNPHVAEERNQKLSADFDDDEEAKYSSVSRTVGVSSGGGAKSDSWKAAPPPSKPAWGSSAGKVPASVASMADATRAPTPVTAPAPAATAPVAATAPKDDGEKPKATGSKLSANAPAFSLSAKATAFVPGAKKPQAEVSPVLNQASLAAAQRAHAINQYQQHMQYMQQMQQYAHMQNPGYNPMMAAYQQQQQQQQMMAYRQQQQQQQQQQHRPPPSQ